MFDINSITKIANRPALALAWGLLDVLSHLFGDELDHEEEE